MTRSVDFDRPGQPYYETVASQEEIYLEVVEEDLRLIFVFDDPSCIVTGKYEEPEMLRLEVSTRLQAYSVSISK